VKQRAIPLNLPGLVWSAGAPLPFVLSSEDRTLVGFVAAGQVSAAEQVSEAAHRECVNVAELIGCTSFKFGFPNDEVLHGHPLFDAGLNYYQLHEVENSSWLRELRAIEAVHDRAPAVPFEEARHFVLTFQDSTLEAIATDIRCIGSYHSRAEALAAMTGLTGLG
jgi:hypothetical protein